MKDRRKKLRHEGTCVDCQKRKAKVGPDGKQHTCCEWCLADRRLRLANSKRQYSLALSGSTEVTL